MGEKTAISWCHHTHNIWEGCFKVSPGCKHCYAEAMNAWLRRGENWGFSAPRRTFAPAHYKQPLAWDKAAKEAGERRRVFGGSVMDIMEVHPDPQINAMLDALRCELWDMVLSTPNLDWLFLTKRPENFAACLPWPSAFAEPFRNVWLGVTAEDQEHADLRIPLLRAFPAAVRFVSYEPALGPIEWSRHLEGEGSPDWLIFGDESGRKRRPAEIEWARATRDACERAGVPFHFKQWAGRDVEGIGGERNKKRVIHLPILDGDQHMEFPR